MKAHRLLMAVPFVMAAIPAHAGQSQLPEERSSAQKAYLAGEFRQAESILNALLAKTPEDPDLLRRLAAVEAALGNLDQAQATIDRAIALAPFDRDIQLARANILLWRKRHTEAERQADELSSAEPDYPGLGQFRSSLLNAQRARKLRLRSVAAGAKVSEAEFASGSEQVWSTQRASTSIGWAETAIAVLEIEREDRLVTDTRISSLVELPIETHRVFFSGSLTPSADFRESWSLGTGADITLGSSNQVRIDGRFSHYRSNDVGTVGIGLRHSFAPHISITARSIHLFGGGEDYRLGGVLRADYSPSRRPNLFLILASYPDTEADGTRQLRTVAGGARFRLSNSFTLSFASEYESRKDSYSRAALSADLSWNFGG
ncbi:tetratricopeptide repeat protein [Altererythrobacter sp. GH1-8]|uniref:tetratricopeptide repeat protein n=1 Tax=Altererythrobacter sp. GH1-8 TaxID=3349333 RepID=UPI00374D28EA